MAEIHDRLRELLENPKLQKAFERAFYTGIESSDEFHKIELADHIRHARGMEVYDSPFEDMCEKLVSRLQALVVDQLPTPSPITAEDISSIAIAQLAGLPLAASAANDHVASAYRRFVTFALLELERRQSTQSSELFDLGDQWELPEQDDEERFFELTWHELWSSLSGFTLYAFIGERSLYGCIKVLGELRGCCSERAFNLVESDVENLIGSVAKTARLCGSNRDSTPITFLVDGDGGRVLRACLDASFGSNKNDILARLAIATQCLVEADNSPSPKGALSNSFAAIESLVCKGHEDKTKTICSCVPALLQPTSLGRTMKGDVLKKYYGLRSKVVHGESVKISLDEAEDVRRVAAGVIRAVCCWRDYRIRCDHGTTWEEFLGELKHASGDGKKVVGVDADLSELLPDE